MSLRSKTTLGAGLFVWVVSAAGCSAGPAVPASSVSFAAVAPVSGAPDSPGAAGSSSGSTAGDDGPLVSVAWSEVLRPAGCTFEDEGQLVELGGTVFGDVTGDGAKDALVVASCLSPSETAPERVYLFDGASSPARPRLLTSAAPPAGLYWRHVRLAVEGPTVHLDSAAVASPSLLCCPDRSYAQILTWDGQGFQASTPVVKPM